MQDLTLEQTPTQANRVRGVRWLLIGGALLSLVGLLCCGLTVFGGFRAFQGLQAESAAIRPTLRAFLDAAHQRDTSAALALFADDAKAEVSAADLQRLFDERPELFASISDVTIETINVTRGTAGTVARVEGFVEHPDGAPRRPYTATLRKDGETWMLMSIQFPDGVGQ